ncbi:hypothetical protein C8Q80DRAFT_1124741 [Daedaleopsis nitida]|nr:hypothetical protein C8Q80DRAFT_1124741 [Daedaleopsis nitida]
MSSDAASEAAELVATYQSLFVDTCCAFAVMALVIYDYAITIGQEVEMFWKRKFTGATVLYLLNRYLLVLDYIFDIATIERTSGNACTVLVKMENAMYSLQYIPWARAVTNARSSQRSLPFGILFLLNVLHLVFTMVSHANHKALHLDTNIESETDSTGNLGADGSRGHEESLVFERVVGSIASSFGAGVHEDEREWDDEGASEDQNDGPGIVRRLNGYVTDLVEIQSASSGMYIQAPGLSINT